MRRLKSILRAPIKALFDKLPKHRVSGHTYGLLFPRDRYMPWKDDASFQASYASVRHRALIGEEGAWELWDLVKQVEPLPGDFIEVGSYRGGSAALIALRAKQLNSVRRVHICDTFEGVVKTSNHDSTFRGGELKSTFGDVRGFFDSLGLDNVNLVKGIFPGDTYAAIESEIVVLANIDTDAYRSSKEAILAIDRLMPVGGVIALGDYGFFNTDGVTTLGNELKAFSHYRSVYNLNGWLIMIKVAERESISR